MGIRAGTARGRRSGRGEVAQGEAVVPGKAKSNV